MISCVYCGGAHARPSDVRECWAQHAMPALPLPAEPAAPPPTERRPAVARSGWHGGRGPAALGRHAIVPDAAAPTGWEGCRRIVVDAAVRESPQGIVDELRRAAAAAESLVIELRTPFDDPPAEIDRRPHHVLGPGHTFWRDELHQLVWGNAVDLRVPGAPRWAVLDAAAAIGAQPVRDAAAGDVVVPTGEAVWLDGGPIRHTDPIAGVPVLHSVQLEHGQFASHGANLTAAELAPDQLAAVTHTGGSARIIAPAGSGKTRVLTERARHLVSAWRIPPAAVSLVAFNKRAQEEMQARTADLRGLEVRTLNSIALAIVNGVPPFAPQHRRWRTIDEPEVRSLLGRFVQTRRQLNVDPLAPWLDALSAMRLGLLAPDEVAMRYGGDVDGLGEVWPRLRDAMESGGVVDFDDQIRRAIDVLLTQPDARRAAQRACRLLLVDEFQDLTPAHLLLVRLLGACGGAVFGVGDDDQTIYGYNGADPGWLIDFATWFPGSGDHPLEVNYRCPAGVVEVADRLLRHNQRRVVKTIRAAAPPSDDAGWSVDVGEDAVAATVAVVESALGEGAAQPSQVAVLTRVNASLAPIQIALATRGVPIASGVGSDFVERVGVRAALAWLRLALGRSLDAGDLAEATRRPSRGFSPRVREWVTEQSSLERMLRLADRLTDAKDSARVTEFAADIARMQALASGGADTGNLLRVLVAEVGLGRAVASLDHNRHGMNRGAQNDDLVALRQIAALHPEPGGFDRWLRDALSTRRDSAGVVLSTVHRVKGQEWPHVIVHMAQPDLFPHRLAEDDEEERRLFHVALTRAARHVTIVTGGDPSPFVAELTNEPPARRPSERPSPAPLARPAGKQVAAEHPLLERSRVMAVEGLVLVDQGQEWTITALEPAAALATRAGALRRFALGEKVETAGRQRGALRPRSGDVDDASVRLFDLLRAFRDRVRNDRPAFTVFDDKTLAAIATALPDDLTQLAAVRGVGAVKLEQYGDDVLELTAAARREVSSGEDRKSIGPGSEVTTAEQEARGGQS